MLRILIIEDDPHACQLLFALLKSQAEAKVVGTIDSVARGRSRLAKSD